MNLYSRFAVPALVVGLALAGCSANSTPEVTPAPSPSPAAVTPAAGDTESESPSPTPTEAPSPTPTAVTGSREAPMRVGDMRQISEQSAFTVGIIGSNLDATAQLANEDPFEDPPQEGHRYITATVKVTVSEEELAAQGFDLSNEGAEPYMTIYVEFVGGDGHGYDSLDSMCMPEDSFAMSGTVYADGASVSGDECVSVPDDAIEGGLWRLSNSLGESVWIEAE